MQWGDTLETLNEKCKKVLIPMVEKLNPELAKILKARRIDQN